jgi:glutamine amidotransferase
MIGIVDYGLGNIQAFLNIYRSLNIEAMRVASADEVLAVDKLILPGVGSFDWAMQRLTGSGLRGVLGAMVRGRGIPILGVCVGMQILAQKSEEGRLPGLGWIDGEVRKFPLSVSGERLRLPHMGWNDVVVKGNGGLLFRGLEDGARFYFLHSYFMVPVDESEEIAVTEYGGIRFAAGVCRRNVYGVQFHPEKSHSWGIRLLQNFAEI